MSGKSYVPWCVQQRANPLDSVRLGRAYLVVQRKILPHENVVTQNGLCTDWPGTHASDARSVMFLLHKGHGTATVLGFYPGGGSDNIAKRLTVSVVPSFLSQAIRLLWSTFFSLRSEPLDESILFKYAADMATAVAHIHESGVVHRDPALRKFAHSPIFASDGGGVSRKLCAIRKQPSR